MRIDIISAIPDLLDSPFNHSILKRAIDRRLVEIDILNLREFGIGKHKQVDDYQYGGGAGMVMMVEPLFNAIEFLTSERTYDDIIFLTPDGTLFEQKLANELSLAKNLLLICGHYKGIDERIRTHLVTREISIGNYVLSGGELAAAVLVDSLVRLIPGVLNNETSALTDSFQDNMLSAPVYTRPANFNGWVVPEVLLSGNDKAIAAWREDQSLKRTRQRRPGLMD